MDRPRRQKKSTNYADFYYPTSKRRKKREKNSKKVTNPESPRKIIRDPSPNSTPRPVEAQVPNLNRVEKSNLKPKPVTTSSKNQDLEAEATPAAQVKTPTTIPAEKRSLTSILNELYTNPDFPTGIGSEWNFYLFRNIELGS